MQIQNPRIYNLKNKFYTIVIVLMTLQSGYVLLAQDPFSSLIYMNDLMLNPALAGSKSFNRVGIGYRNHTPDIDLGYRTYSAFYDQPSKSLHGGFGFAIMNDVQGNNAISHTNLDAIYSYAFNITRDLKMRFGSQVSLYQYAVNTQNLVFPDMIDPVSGITSPTSEQLANLSNMFVDFSAGLAFSYKDMFGGFKAGHLTEPKTNYRTVPTNIESRLYRNYAGYFGYTFEFTSKKRSPYMYRKDPSYVVPMVYYFNQGGSDYIYWGANFFTNNFHLGLWLLHADRNYKVHSINTSIGFEVSERIILSYGYDLTISNDEFYKPFTGGHELSLVYKFKTSYKKTLKDKKKMYRLKCPNF